MRIVFALSIGNRVFYPWVLHVFLFLKTTLYICKLYGYKGARGLEYAFQWSVVDKVVFP